MICAAVRTLSGWSHTAVTTAMRWSCVRSLRDAIGSQRGRSRRSVASLRVASRSAVGIIRMPVASQLITRAQSSTMSSLEPACCH